MFIKGSDIFAVYGVPLGNGGSTISAAYTTVRADEGLALVHDVGDNSARIFTIDSNANVPYPLYTCLLVVNLKNTLTVKVTSDTQTLANSATTGDRTLAVNGVGMWYKVGTTSWLCWGPGLT